MILNIKHHEQTTPYSCGPACLQMVFGFYGKEYTPDELLIICRTKPHRGTSHERMIAAVLGEDFDYYAKSDGTVEELITYIDKGLPVIVNYLNPTSGIGHYAVVKGYDKGKELLVLADPKNGDNYEIGWSDFSGRWFNTTLTSKHWFIVVKKK